MKLSNLTDKQSLDVLLIKKQLEGVGEYITGKEVGINETIDQYNQLEFSGDV